LGLEQSDRTARGAPLILLAAILQRLIAAAREPVRSRQPSGVKRSMRFVRQRAA
jgi:hypothetical protein